LRNFDNFDASRRTPPTPLHLSTIMPRTPLGQISGNSNQRGGKEGRLELTPYWRTKICGRMDTGDSPKVISDALQIPMSTISTTYRREPERHENESKFRSGRSTVVGEDGPGHEMNARSWREKTASCPPPSTTCQEASPTAGFSHAPNPTQKLQIRACIHNVCCNAKRSNDDPTVDFS
jgi:hypothetical protein